jgi:hypothetical protein
VNREAGRRPAPAAALVAAVLLIGGLSLPACTGVRLAVPACGATSRLGLVAQSVPGAAYVPCLKALAPGWSAGGFVAASGHTRFTLTSDRASGHPVRVDLRAGCNLTGATPTPPRDPGVRTSLVLTSIAPRYAGTLLDVFPGGCVSYRFDFQRGPHIALMEEFEDAVALYPRQQLAAEVHRRLGVSLTP